MQDKFSIDWYTYIAIFLILNAPLVAFGQQNNVNGFKLGQFILSPSIILDTHIIHNPGRMPQFRAKNDLSLSVKPVLALVRQSNRWILQADVQLQYQYYINTTQFSSWTGQANTEAVIFPNRPLTFYISEKFERTDIPATQSLVNRYIHNTNLLKGGLSWKLGDGALMLDFEYGIWLDVYDHSSLNTPNHPELLNHIKQLPQLIVKWKFFPKTAVFATINADITNYFNKQPFRQMTQTGNSNLDMHLLNTSGGIIGQLSRHFELTLKLGYANTFLQENQYNDNFESWIGQLQMTYKPTPTMQLHFGLDRSVQAASFFGYMNENKIELQWYWMLGRRLQIHLGGSYNFLQYWSNLV